MMQSCYGLTYFRRLKPVDLEVWICFLVVRDGRCCAGCKTPLHQLMHKIELDHVDGNSMNDVPDGSNYQLLCKSCNVAKENFMRG